MYKALNELHSSHGHEGLCILGFPSREFGGQEFKTGAEIRKFVSKKGVEFDMMDLSKVNPGPDQNPVYQFLMAQTEKHGINWNFSTTFLVDRTGKVRYRIDKQFDEVKKLVGELLAEKNDQQPRRVSQQEQSSEVKEAEQPKESVKEAAPAPKVAVTTDQPVQAS